MEIKGHTSPILRFVVGYPLRLCFQSKLISIGYLLFLYPIFTDAKFTFKARNSWTFYNLNILIIKWFERQSEI